MNKSMYSLTAIGVILFIALAAFYETTFAKMIDDYAASLIGGSSFIEAFHYIGDTKFVAFIAIILIVWLAVFERNYRGILFIVFSFVGSIVINQILKRIFERPRPELIDQLTSFSFPSGHSMLAISYLLATVYIISERTMRKNQVVAAYVLAVGLIILTGLSRVAGMRHYLSDVLAGWSLGFVWVVICITWYEWRKNKWKKHS